MSNRKQTWSMRRTTKKSAILMNLKMKKFKEFLKITLAFGLRIKEEGSKKYYQRHLNGHMRMKLMMIFYFKAQKSKEHQLLDKKSNKTLRSNTIWKTKSKMSIVNLLHLASIQLTAKRIKIITFNPHQLLNNQTWETTLKQWTKNLFIKLRTLLMKLKRIKVIKVLKFIKKKKTNENE